ncbi:acyl-CoA synthetase [Lysinibacillus sp. LZ02]|uniref:acyl-CoA synthetase n=1 Tax=Lysinibacillus sp. LZ02 TaxID=3420668 RepID=UPI003D368DEE
MNYNQYYHDFSWTEVFEQYGWNPKEKFNLAHECCDKWADDPNRIAIYWHDENGNRDAWTYSRLRETSNRMANLLKYKGIKKGDKVSGLLGKDMELIITILATWKIGAVYVPLFTAFGPDAILHRINDAECKLLVTNNEQHNKIKDFELSTEIIRIDEVNDKGLNFWDYLNTFSSIHETEPTSENDPCVIQYTSGSTGLPKGAVWAHKILYSEYSLFKYGMGISEDDIVFGGPDLGWAHGLMNCTLGPLNLGISNVIYKGSFDAENLYRIWEEYNVTNVLYSPTAFRMMLNSGVDRIKKFNLKVKKFSSAGETLNTDLVEFIEQEFNAKICDLYGSTEAGMIIANYHGLDVPVKPGSMGRVVPGYEVKLVNSEGEEVKDGEVGEIILDAKQIPFFCLGYYNNEEKFNEKIINNHFYTGDLAIRDQDGYYWYKGRADDVISSAGYRIGPVEIEACLLEHPLVGEAAVIGKPDPLKGEIVKAYVKLINPADEKESLKDELSLFVKNKLSKHQYPKEIEFIQELPKTASGKIQRYILKERNELVDNNM